MPLQVSTTGGITVDDQSLIPAAFVIQMGSAGGVILPADAVMQDVADSTLDGNPNGNKVVACTGANNHLLQGVYTGQNLSNPQAPRTNVNGTNDAGTAEDTNGGAGQTKGFDAASGNIITFTVFGATPVRGFRVTAGSDIAAGDSLDIDESSTGALEKGTNATSALQPMFTALQDFSLPLDTELGILARVNCM